MVRMTKQNVAVQEAVTMAVPPAAAVGSPSPMFPYPPPRAATRGYMRKRLLKHLDIGGGLHGGRVSAWVESMRASSPTHDDARSPWTLEHPSALSTFGEIAKLFEDKQIVVFLDYDGTLSPIVEDPECAFMDDAMRDTLRDVAKYFPTAIVSGRCRDKVYSFVQLPELYYAGSHGMDIKGPDIISGPKCTAVQAAESVLHQPAGDFLPMIAQVYKTLSKKMKSIPGARVENNKFCLSVHFRCVDQKRWSGLAEQVRAVLRDYPELRLTHGRKVLEIRPTVKWDKGKALEFLLESLGFVDCNDVLPVYIGDDRTDEDAFRVLRERGQGFGILVSKIPRDTHASYSLQEPSEVKEFLKRLVDWRQQGGVGNPQDFH